MTGGVEILQTIKDGNTENYHNKLRKNNVYIRLKKKKIDMKIKYNTHTIDSNQVLNPFIRGTEFRRQNRTLIDLSI